MATPKVGPSPSPSRSALRIVSSCQDVAFLQLPESGELPRCSQTLLEEGASTVHDCVTHSLWMEGKPQR